MHDSWLRAGPRWREWLWLSAPRRRPCTGLGARKPSGSRGVGVVGLRGGRGRGGDGRGLLRMASEGTRRSTHAEEFRFVEGRCAVAPPDQNQVVEPARRRRVYGYLRTEEELL
jgi:hypothetical protein